MKNNFPFEFHILYYFTALLCLLTGHFKDFIWISMLIIIHELGHVTGAIVQGWHIEKVMMLPFGGMTILKEQCNRPIHEEWIIVLLGPLYQIAFVSILSLLYGTNSTFIMYHYLLLGFNLLPIIPLDGYKMLQLFLETFFSYRNAKYVGFWISILCLSGCIGYTFLSKNLILGMILLFLIKENIHFYHEIPYLIDKFLLERYLHTFSFSKQKKIKGLQLHKMKRGYSHLFWIEDRWQDENSVFRCYHFK